MNVNPSNVLEWITNDQPKFSFLHHESSTLTWHTLKDPSIRRSISTTRGRRFDSHGLPNHNLGIVFERQTRSAHSEFLEEYNSTTRKAHPLGVSDFNLNIVQTTNCFGAVPSVSSRAK